MVPEDKPQVRGVFRRSFPILQQVFFGWTPDVLVAERDGSILGAVMLKTYRLPGDQKGGFISWIFTAPEARGLGVGQRLTEGAIDFFESRGCVEVAAAVEGYNFSSSKLFATRGFSILSPGQQLRRYGLSILPTWVSWFHLFDIGHFIWARPGSAAADNPALQWWGTWLVQTLIALLALWRGNDLSPLSLIAVPLLLLVFFGARTLAMRRAAAAQGLEVRYRAWETAMLVSLLIGVLFSSVFPAPGSLYPTANRDSYRKLLPKLGPMALAGVLPTLVLLGIAWALDQFAGRAGALGPWVGHALYIGAPMALFDVVTIFFPFASFNGRRIWDWNRPLWVLLAAAALVMFFV
jgi:GNAT superfamily N-acetyltransferase